jgi:hypothetical protein
MLQNTGDIYTFLPTELTDDNASLYDRSVPVEFKRSNLVMELKKPEIMKESHITFNELLSDLEKKLDMVFGNIDTSNIKGQEFYTRSRALIEYMDKTHFISTENLRKYYIHHFLDVLTLPEKLVIIMDIYTDPPKDDNKNFNSDLEKEVRMYFRKIDILNKNYIVTTDTKKNYLYSMEEIVTGNDNAQKGLDDQITKIVKPPINDLNNTYIGYFSIFKDSLVPVFKIKDIGGKKSKGISIEKQGKENVIKILNIMKDQLTVIKKSTPQIVLYTIANTKINIQTIDLCIILEMIMREIQFLCMKSKVKTFVFLTPEEAVYQ